MFHLDLSEKKKQRNKLIGFTVGAIGLLAIPVVGGALAVGGTVFALQAISGAGVTATAAAVAAGTLFTLFIYFSKVSAILLELIIFVH